MLFRRKFTNNNLIEQYFVIIIEIENAFWS